jgi:pimeloyl-ACP methyl ester carboxylesterase
MLFATVVLLAGVITGGLSPSGQTSSGVVNGAAYRLAVPTPWDGTVVIFLPGYSDAPASFDTSAPLDALAEQLVSQGILYVEAGYRRGGWAIAEALEDVPRLRDQIAARHGTPKRVILMGESMGGMIALALLERDPTKYHGGLAFCSGTISAYDYFKRNAFDVLILFDALFPSILPSPDKIPASFRPSEQLLGTVAKALQAAPQRAAILQNETSVREIGSLAELLVLHTEALRELAVRSGGNPFDNTTTEYAGLGESGKPIAEPRHAVSVAVAERYLRHFYTPTGSLRVPFLAVNASVDPVVPRWATDAYLRGNQWFQQQYVEATGHCGVTKEQRLAALETLEAWIERGRASR